MPEIDLTLIKKDVEEKNIIPDTTPNKTESEMQTYETQRKIIDNHGAFQILEMQKEYAKNIFILIVLWLLFIGFIIIETGQFNKFHLSDTILITLITTSTVNVLGLFIIVIKYIYK